MPCTQVQSQHYKIQFQKGFEMTGDRNECLPPEMDLKRDTKNKATVAALYKALANGHREGMTKLLASDLEWWFRGPPHCQHMMKIITAASSHNEFRFRPQSIEVIGDFVIAEGWEGGPVYWVHVWTLKDGLITQFREYINTWLTVTDTRPNGWKAGHKIHTLWQSKPRDLFRRSFPGILLAI